MDVRCDRCQTEYELDESRITDAGVAVKCTNCGNVFKVRPRGGAPTISGTVPVQGVPPVLGSPQASAPVLGGNQPRVWYVRRYDGSTLTLNDLTDLQRAVVERQVAPDDGVSISGGAWHTLGSIPELASFFEVVRASGRATTGSMPAAEGVDGGTAGAGPGARRTTASLPAQGRTLTPVWEEGPSALGAITTPGGDPAWVSRDSPADPELEALMEKEDTQFIRKNRMGRWIGILVVLALVGGGIAVYGLGVPGMSAPGTLPVAPIKPPDVNALPRPPGSAEAAAPAAAPAPTPAPKPNEAAPAPTPAEAKPTAAAAPAPAAKAEKSEPAAGVKKAAPAAEAAEGGAPAGKSFDYYIAQGHKLLDSKPSTALALFDKAAELDPKSPEPDSGRGLAFANMEKLGDASTAFQAALRKSSEFTEAILGLAEVSAQQGNRKKAIGLYQRYLDLTPDGPDAPAARAQLDELKAESPAPAPAAAAAAPAALAPAPAAPAPAPPVAAEKPADFPPPPPVVVPDTAPPAR